MTNAMSLLFSFYTVIIFSVVNLHAANEKITPDKLEQYINGDSTFEFILVDLRDLVATDTVIASEVCKPYNLSWNADVFRKTISKIPHSTPLILYCLSGVRSTSAAAMLTDSGFTDIKTLDGGIKNWQRNAKPVSYVKPSSDLPAFSTVSVHAKSIMCQYGSGSGMHFNSRSMLISVADIISEMHSVYILDVRGRTIYSAENIFNKNQFFNLSDKYSKGRYMVILRRSGIQNVLPVTIVE